MSKPKTGDWTEVTDAELWDPEGNCGSETVGCGHWGMRRLPVGRWFRCNDCQTLIPVMNGPGLNTNEAVFLFGKLHTMIERLTERVEELERRVSVLSCWP